MFLRGRRDFDEEEGKEREDQGLNQADEYLQEKKGDGHDEFGQGQHHDQQNLPREDVAEETEREGDDFRELGDKLQDADEEHDRALELDEPAEESLESQALDAVDLDQEYRDQGQGQGRVEVGRCAPEQGHEGRMAFLEPVKADRTEPGQKAEPVDEEHEKEKGHDEGKVLPALILVLEHVAHGSIKKFQDVFDHVLEPGGHDVFPEPDEDADDKENNNGDPGDEKGIGDRQGPDTEQFLGRDRNMHAQHYIQEIRFVK